MAKLRLNLRDLDSNQKVTTDDYPYIISQHFGSDHRAQRVTARILDVPVGTMTVVSRRCFLDLIAGQRISFSQNQA